MCLKCYEYHVLAFAKGFHKWQCQKLFGVDVNKDTTGKFTQVKGFSILLCYFNESIIYWMASDKFKLILKEEIESLKTIFINSTSSNLLMFDNLRDIGV